MPSTHEPLVNACIRGNLATVKQLLVNGADIEGIWRSCTGLMWAAAEGHLPIVELLLTVGADVNARNGVNYTALLYAAESDHRDIALTPNVGGWTPLMMASARGDIDIMELLLAQGADVAPQNRWGGTALSEAKQSFRARQAVAMLQQARAQ